MISSGSALFADDFTTTDGEHYSGTIKRVEPDGIVLATADGVSKIKFKNLSPDVAKKYGYRPEDGKAFESAQIQQKINGVAAAQLAKDRAERFDDWKQEIARKRNILLTLNSENRALNEPDAREFEARFKTLQDLIKALDDHGISCEVTKELIDAVYNKQIFIGMPDIFVRLSWGDPININNTLTSNGGSSSQWVYYKGGYGRAYVYLKNGVVETIQD